MRGDADLTGRDEREDDRVFSPHVGASAGRKKSGNRSVADLTGTGSLYDPAVMVVIVNAVSSIGDYKVLGSMRCKCGPTIGLSDFFWVRGLNYLRPTRFYMM